MRRGPQIPLHFSYLAEIVWSCGHEFLRRPSPRSYNVRPSTIRTRRRPSGPVPSPRLGSRSSTPLLLAEPRPICLQGGLSRSQRH